MKVENQLAEEVLVIETQLLEKFQVEELEKRYEFSWFTTIIDGFLNGGTGSVTGK